MFDFEKQDIVADSYTFRKTKGTSGTARSMASGEGLFYKVKKGDTLSKIASRQGTSIDKLCKLNRYYPENDYSARDRYCVAHKNGNTL